MGVLIKPDLVTETATRGAIIDLVLGRRSTLKLGYYVVKNRSTDDNSSTLSERAAAEQVFFMAPAWLPISDRYSTIALKLKVCELLMHISKQEFPYVKADIEQRLRQCRADLETMGPSRADLNSQRMYLGKLASRFLAITQAALNGYYAGDSIFKRQPNLKLITKIMKLNEVFSNVFWKRGYKQHFGPTWDDEGESLLGSNVDQLPFGIPLSEYPELEAIIRIDDYRCPKPSKGPIMGHIEDVFQSSRGPELRTDNNNKQYVAMSQISKHAVGKDNGQQVVFHLMLEGDGSLLKVFNPELIMNLNTEQLEQIAGEDAESKHQRHVLKQEMESLEAALKVLRS
ncbi:interferon-induced GTP-binding protein Mx1 [Colletotrichum kahawae]|uniref:Interferon-induced GTP-binding protein Mx1 n=1 Tax=Colletotrichum kahawae TaxID=34407 RepID=A0AAD9Y3X4_COLKA|nr:interferon-induced GTP-binding protein Mx1 [Colletotrichum kahawae]